MSYSVLVKGDREYVTCDDCGSVIDNPDDTIRCELRDGFYYHYLQNADGTETRVPRHVVAFVDVRAEAWPA